MMSRTKTFLTMAALASLAAFLLAGCAPRSGSRRGVARPPEQGQQAGQGGRRFGAIPVLAVTAKMNPLMAGNDTAATVAPVMQSTVASQVAGVVQHVVHLAGDWVKQGEPVVVLDTSQLKLAVANAQAALDNAKINYQIGAGQREQGQSEAHTPAPIRAVRSGQRAEELRLSEGPFGHRRGAGASAVDNALSQLQQAQANLQAAQTALDQNKKSDVWTLQQLAPGNRPGPGPAPDSAAELHYASITAPFTGQIAAVNVNPGMYVSTNTPVYIIVSADKEINFNVPPADAPNLPVGTAVQFTYQGRTANVRISQAPSAPINGVVPMVATLPRSVPASLRRRGNRHVLPHPCPRGHRAHCRAGNE